jgi:hypothetical protein
MTTTDDTKNGLDEKLSYLKLSYMRENYESLAKKAAQKQWTHVNYLTELATAEAKNWPPLKPTCDRIVLRIDASAPRAFPRSKHWSSSSGHGPIKSTSFR